MIDTQTTDQSQTGNSQPPERLVSQIEALGQRMAAVREHIGRVIFGQEDVVEQTLITLLAGGHALLVGYPGLGKTRLVDTLAQCWGWKIGASSSRRT